MFLFIFFGILNQQVIGGTEFNNSCLRNGPWPIRDCGKLYCPMNSDQECLDNLCDENGVCNVRVSVILPNSTNYIVNIEKAKTVLEEAAEIGFEQNFLHSSVNISYEFHDDQCSQDKAALGIIKSAKCTNVIFGPICDYCLASVGRILKYLGYFGIPLFTPVGFTFDFTNKKNEYDDEMFMLTNSGYSDYRSYGEFFHMIMEEYKWSKIVLMYEKSQQNEVSGESSCQLFMRTLMDELKTVSQIDFVDGDLEIIDLNYTNFFTEKVGTKYSIILTCTNNSNLRKMLIEAQALKMFDKGEYVFFNFELFNNATNASMPWYIEGDNNNDAASIAYQSLYTFTPHTEVDFQAVEERGDDFRGSIYLDGLRDGMLIYMQALGKVLKYNTTGHPMPNQRITGCSVLEQIMGHTFEGRSRNKSIDITMNCNAQRVTKIALMNVNSELNYSVVGVYSIENKTIDNWTVKWPFGIPSDTPKCGFDLSNCPTDDPVNILVISLVSAVTLCVLACSYIIYRHFKYKRELYSEAWKINYDDINFFPNKPRRNSVSQVSLKSDYDGYSIQGDHQLYASIAYYKQNRVALKRLKTLRFDFSHNYLVELKVMRDLSQDNLVKFYGVCMDKEYFVLTEYCPKGSLQDILENDNLNLDGEFRMSLMKDLVRGMIYLHNSPIKSHGALKSSNCLIDSRFVLKISDFGLHFLRNYYEYDDDRFDETSHSYWTRKLWTAPELLRVDGFPLGGTQKGDVYSFGIILHEVMTRQGVFYLGEGNCMEVRGMLKIKTINLELNM